MGDVERSRRERAERAAAHRAADERRRSAESERAQVLLDRFVADAELRGHPPEKLTARPWNGRGRYPTGLVGWYLRGDRTLGVTREGDYYVLTVPPRRFGRWRTLQLTPTPPPLRVGEGARDGESMDLATLLQIRLDA